jgi:hypothetical protein
MTLTIEIPEALGAVDERYIREALFATLYHAGKLSARQAREALGMTRRAFEEMLPRFNLSILADTPENLAIELKA